jgi:hypothetical protein
MASVGDPGLLATIARSAILVFATLMALDQLQIAPTIIDTLWTALIGMFAVAGALAFGLGGRDLAKRILENWYDTGQEKAQDVRDAMREDRYATPSAPPPATPVTSMPPPAGAPERPERRAA